MPTVALLLLALGAPYTGNVEDAKRDSEAVVQSFLELVDAGEADETWMAAASFLKKQMTREQWRLTIEAGRAGTGKVRSRRRDGTYFTEILPNAPPGTYVVVEYRGDFQKQSPVRERITAVFEDGVWRICGYFMNYDLKKATLPARR